MYACCNLCVLNKFYTATSMEYASEIKNEELVPSNS